MMMIGNQSNVSFSKGIAFVILNYMYVCEGYRHMLAVANGDHKRASGPLEVEFQRASEPSVLSTELESSARAGP